jgi:hypothetical protein
LKTKIGDIWESNGGKLRIRVVGHREISGCRCAVWEGVNRRDSGTCADVNFDRKRKLVERDGKPVTS